MDCKFVQSAVQKWLYDCNHHYQCLNYKKSGYFESDILAVTLSHIVTEVEVKVSLSDFRADFKKKHKHHCMENYSNEVVHNVPNKFYYACPEGMIKESMSLIMQV